MSDHLPSETSWHLVVQGWPVVARSGGEVLVEGRRLATIDLGGEAALALLPVDFEQAYRALDGLGMFIEGDGSFCWTAPAAAWRVFGELYDGGERLAYAELKGCCPQPELRKLLAALGHDSEPLLIQLARQGLYTDFDAFLEWAFSH